MKGPVRAVDHQLLVLTGEIRGATGSNGGPGAVN